MTAPKAAGNVTLDEAHRVFRRWFGPDYDLDALDAVLAAAAVERLDGDPVWLLLISGPGNTKTETVTSLAGAGALVRSSISGEAGLLSATAKKERSKDATGGLLREIGAHGVLVVKDFTTILSMNRDRRAETLGALREIYDGAWTRNVGSDGGRTLSWTGRIVVIGAVTSAWDQAHAVISAMGDRFALLRIDSGKGRMAAGRQALANVGHEEQMRTELAAAVAGALAGVAAKAPTITLAVEVNEILLAAANLVTRARTAVERDYRGDVIEAHAPEAPTRFAKMLAQIARGCLSLGMGERAAVGLALRIAADSMPPLRLLVLRDLDAKPSSRTSDVRERVQRPRSTVDRTLQELHVLGLAVYEDLGDGLGWRYSLVDGIDLAALDHNQKCSPLPQDPQEGMDPATGSEPNGALPGQGLDIPGRGPAAEDCTTCGCAMDVYEAGQTTHPGCDRAAS